MTYSPITSSRFKGIVTWPQTASPAQSHHFGKAALLAALLIGWATGISAQASPRASRPPQVASTQPTSGLTSSPDRASSTVPAPSSSQTVITLVSPAVVLTGGATPISVLGAGFYPNSRLVVNGAFVPTTYVSSTELQGTVPPRYLVSPAVLFVGVFNSAHSVSSRVSLTVLQVGVVSPTNHPLVASYAFSSPRAASVSIEFGPDTNYGRSTSASSIGPNGGSGTILVAGMRASTTYHMRAVYDFPDGTEFHDADHTFTTGAIPASRLPQISTSFPGTQSPNSGVEMLCLTSGGNNNPLKAVITDMDGNVIWYYDMDPTGTTGQAPLPMKLLSNGHLLINISPYISPPGTPNILREVDLAGNTVREISADQLNTRLAAAGYPSSSTVIQIHHDVTPLPNGHLVLLTQVSKIFASLPGFPNGVDVLGDQLVDVDENLNPVWVWNEFDHLDVNRHPWSLPDWTHSNALLYSPDDGNLLLSIRHQNWILKIDYQDGRGSGDILWKLGYQGDFDLQGGNPPDWFYAQHGPEIISPNSSGNFKLAIFDNGDFRVLDANGTQCIGNPGTTPCYSRPLVMGVDEPTKTAQILWEDKLSVFSPFLGDVIQFENGNLEFDIGAISIGPPAAQVQEVTGDSSAEILWQMDINGQFAYRAFRIPSLYPGVQW